MRADVVWHFAGEKDYERLPGVEIEPLLPGSTITADCKVRVWISDQPDICTVERIDADPELVITIRLSKSAP
jgi:hypothetical protein